MQKADHDRFYVKDPTGFSAARNKAIVEQTIQEYDAMRAKKAAEHDDSYAERSDAVVSYLKHLDQGLGESNMSRYFGKKTLAYLRGQQIRETLMKGMTVKNKSGIILKRGS